jgi:hypothetical protein
MTVTTEEALRRTNAKFAEIIRFIAAERDALKADQFSQSETSVHHVFLLLEDARRAVVRLNKDELERERSKPRGAEDYTKWYYYEPSHINEDLVEA